MRTLPATYVLSLACLSACAGDELSVGGGEDLQRDDVENLPPGDATSVDLSGSYIFTAADRRSCSCRAGDEAQLCDVTLAAQGISLTQAGGALELEWLESSELQDDLLLTGGVDDDGSFVVGGLNALRDVTGDPIGDVLNRVEGVVAQGVGGDVAWMLRGQGIVDGESIDCTIVFDLTISWWDPESTRSCWDDSDCHPGQPHCVNDVCTDGSVGAACGFSKDCASGFCVDDVCSAGAAGDGCSFPSDCLSEACLGGVCSGGQDCASTGCASGQVCFGGSCQDGTEGDPCENPLQCAASFSCFEGTCYDGSEGDPCGSTVECNADNMVCYQDRCQDGSEGDPCEGIGQCSIEASRCVQSTCQDGSAGDPCEVALDCDGIAGLMCLPGGTCG